MTIQDVNKKTIVLKAFFYRGKTVALKDISTNNNGLYVAAFVNLIQTKKPTILHEDHKKEAGNEPPQLQEKIPFELKNNEGVISYTENGKLKYYKVESIIEKIPIYYPSAPENKQ